MGVKYIVDNLDGVDESLQDKYVAQDDGSYKFDIDVGGKLVDISEYKKAQSTIEEERKRAGEYSTQAKTLLDKLGLESADKVDDYLTKMKEREEGLNKDSSLSQQQAIQKVQREKEEMENLLRKEIETKASIIEQTKKNYHDHLIDNSIQYELSRHHANSQGLRYLRKDLKDLIGVQEGDNGEAHLVVYSDSTRKEEGLTASPDGKFSKKTLADLIQETAKSEPTFFNSTTISGDGMESGNNGSEVTKQYTKAEWFSLMQEKTGKERAALSALRSANKIKVV